MMIEVAMWRRSSEMRKILFHLYTPASARLPPFANLSTESQSFSWQSRELWMLVGGAGIRFQYNCWTHDSLLLIGAAYMHFKCGGYESVLVNSGVRKTLLGVLTCLNRVGGKWSTFLGSWGRLDHVWKLGARQNVLLLLVMQITLQKNQD
jgi:hypothetical protein